jgi:hypothetical protein
VVHCEGAMHPTACCVTFLGSIKNGRSFVL